MAARWGLRCSKHPDKQASFAFADSRRVVSKITSSYFDIFPSSFQLASFITVLSLFRRFSTKISSTDVLVMVFNCITIAASHYSCTFRAAAYYRLGGILLGHLDKRSQKQARTSKWSVPFMIPFNASPNVWQSSTDEGRWDCTRIWSFWCAVWPSFKYPAKRRSFGCWKRVLQATNLLMSEKFTSRDPFSQRWPFQTALGYCIWVCPKGHSARSSLMQ